MNEEFLEKIKSYLPVELVDIIETSSPEDRTRIFQALTPEVAVETFEFLPFTYQKEFLAALPSDRAAHLLNVLSPDDRTAFLEELPSPVVKELIKLLTYGERVLTLKLLGYPENSVGRLMTPDYIAIKANWTVQEAFDYVRRYGHYSETIDILYVIDDKGNLIDDLALKDLLFAAPETKIITLCDNKFIAILASDDQESAINVFRKNNRLALPVTDSKGILLGIVTIDDILDIIKEEDTEDMQKIGGMEALDEPYMQTPFLELMRKRAGWLVFLFLGETLTATAMAYYQDEVSRAVVLALFVPLIISSGGNSGSQASTLIIRAMALGEISLRDWWAIMHREILSGLFLGTVLGMIGFLRIAIWSTFSTTYDPHPILIALTVGLSLVGVVLWGTLSGSMLPLILKKLGFDPATSSAPFVATLVDVTGLVIYFSIALYILSGSLL